jgi:DNA polymerase elongation subunit (family B)
MTTLLRVTDLEYSTDEEETWLTVVGRAADGTRRNVDVEGLDPYVFIEESQPVDQAEQHITGVEEGYESYDGVPLKKVFLRHPKDTNGKCTDCYTDEQRQDDDFEGIQSEYEGHLYEADVPFVRRAGIDGGLSGYIMVPDSGTVHIDDVDTDIDPSDVGTIEPRVFMADIEAMPPENLNDFDKFKEEAKGEITAITVYDTYEDEYVVLSLDPEGMINGGAVRNHIEEHWSDLTYEDAGGVLHNESGDIDATEYVECDITLHNCQTEEALLDEFLSLIEDRRPDLLSGWNWVDFDHEYILNRLEHFDDLSASRMSEIGHSYGYKTAQRIDGLPGFDMMEAFCEKMTFSEWRSQRLDYVADEELNVGKVADVSVGKEYKENRSRFLAYNIIDTQLLVALDEKHGIHEFYYQLSNLTSIQIYDAFYEMRLVDGFLMSQRGDDEILPVAEEQDLDKIPGGLVLKPANGVHEWVATFDLKSLYPSVFITLNVSEETLTYDESEADAICPGMPADEEAAGGEITEEDISWDIADEPGQGTSKGNAVGLSFDHEGIIPKYLRLLFDERASMKNLRDKYNPDEPEYTVYDNRQRAVKVVMNSFYGVTQSPYYRLATEDLGATITAGGRYTLWRGAQIARDMGYNVRYGDTDSILIELDGDDEDPTVEEVIETGEAVEKAIDEAMTEVRKEFGIDEHPYIDMEELPHELPDDVEHALSWEFEKLYRRWMQSGSKKRYAGLPIWAEGKFYVDDVDNLEEELLDVDPSITGYEPERADVPVVTERTMTNFIKMLLAGADFSETSDYIQEEVGRVRNMDLPAHQVAEPGVINKPLEEYPSMPVKRACLYANEHLNHDWREGDDPWLFPIRDTPTMMPQTDVLGLSWGEEPPEGYDVDVDRVVQKKLREPLEPILSVTDYDFDELKTGRRVQGIDVGGGGPDAFGKTEPSPDDSDPFESDVKSDEPDESGEPDDEPADPFADSAESTSSGGSAFDW